MALLSQLLAAPGAALSAGQGLLGDALSTPERRNIWAGAIQDIGNIWTRGPGAPGGLVSGGNLQRAFSRNAQLGRDRQTAQYNQMRMQILQQQLEAARAQQEIEQQQRLEQQQREEAARAAYMVPGMLAQEMGPPTAGGEMGINPMVDPRAPTTLPEMMQGYARMSAVDPERGLRGMKTVAGIQNAMQPTVAQQMKPFSVGKGATVFDPNTNTFRTPPGGSEIAVDPLERAKTQDMFIKQEKSFGDDFRTVSANYRTLMNAPATGAGDIVSVKMFEKILDPGSVVRAEEAAEVSAARGIFNRWKGELQQAAGWGKLTEEARQELRDAITVAYNIRQKQYAEQKAKLDNRAIQAGIDPANLTPTVEGYKPQPAAPQPVPAGSIPAQPGGTLPPGLMLLPEPDVLDMGGGS